jgi:hypothetical protein
LGLLGFDFVGVVNRVGEKIAQGGGCLRAPLRDLKIRERRANALVTPGVGVACQGCNELRPFLGRSVRDMGGSEDEGAITQ